MFDKIVIIRERNSRDRWADKLGCTGFLLLSYLIHIYYSLPIFLVLFRVFFPTLSVGITTTYLSWIDAVLQAVAASSLETVANVLVRL